MKRSLNRSIGSLIIAISSLGSNAFAEEAVQDDVSKALDSTATQWSFQLAYQNMPNYKDDYVDGKQRPEGSTDFVQFRIVAPLGVSNIPPLPFRFQRRFQKRKRLVRGIG